ncbi:MAG TPA: response regulator transcription factor [Solirubrobacteraceae bacterium]|jgi:DNA-binding NarL/FixJ family response regulator|nr:response regulator transcription factor [Solirubrobacteraceae bacterium]
MQQSAHSSLKVLVADDHPLILQGLRRTLEACDDIDVVGEARSGDEVVPLVERRRPDVVLLDMRMPGMQSAECIRRIAQSWPEVKTVVLSASEDRATIDSAVAAGASAYVLKSVSALDVPALIRQVAAGYTLYHAPADDGEKAAAAREAGAELTEREATILAAVAAGKTTKAISSELWVTEHTVKFHLTNIYRKLGVSNRSGAVRYAFEHGLAGSGS